MGNKLVSFWSEFDATSPPYIHPEDADHIFKTGKFAGRKFRNIDLLHHQDWDFHSFVESEAFGNENDKKIYSSILPTPQ